MRTSILISILLGLNVLSTAQSVHKQNLNADKLYKAKKYDQAAEAYSRSHAITPSPKAQYNKGNALMQTKKWEDAVGSYDGAIESMTNNKEKAMAHYNRGNAAFEQKKYDNAIENYKQSLKLNPNDLQTKENLAIAKRALQKQQQEDKKNQNKDQNQEKDEQKKDQKDQNSDNQNQQDPNKDQKEKKENENQKDQKPSQKDPNNKPQKPNSALSRDQAERLMKSMDDREQKVQQKMMRTDPNKPKSSKDW